MNEKAKDFIKKYYDYYFGKGDKEYAEICFYIQTLIIKEWAKERLRKENKSIYKRSILTGNVVEYTPLNVTISEDGLTFWFGDFISDTEFARYIDYGIDWSFSREDLE